MFYGIIEVASAIIAIFLIVYYYFTLTFNFWNNRGVSGPKPIPLFGNFKNIMFGNVSLNDFLKKEYECYKNEPMFGVFARRKPVLIMKDPELIKDVLIKDFSVFADRGIVIHEKVEPLSQHLFSLEPARWRPLRSKLSPVFSSGKLKEMFYLLLECANHFEQFLNTYMEKHSIVEVRELTAKFTTDVIGVCAFGLKMNSIAEEDSKFRKIGRKVFATTTFNVIKFRIREAAPWLFKLLSPIMYDYEINNFFISTMNNTIKHREKNNIKRNDFVDLLMEIKNNPNKVGDIEMTDTLITAQAFVFFIAGFETSSTSMSNALYELALNQQIQDKLRQEINEELEKNKGDLKYENIKNLKYMHKVFCETLRKYPPLATIMRMTTKSYKFSGTEVTIPEKTRVWIPIYAIQHDSDIYPDPDIFDPERFEEENVKQRHSSFYLPFGDGPRNCIGARFANYQTKVGLIKILKNYKIDICEKTCIPYEFNPRSFLLTPKKGIFLKFTKIT